MSHSATRAAWTFSMAWRSPRKAVSCPGIRVRYTEMHRILRRDPELNQRQRSILSKALRDPHATFRIGYHRTNHNIAYATARRDLVELEQRGYLISQMRGKAWVFAPSESLAEMLNQT